MERNLMGELDMYRQLGKTPNYSELARRYGIDRHTVSRYFNKEVFEQDLRSAKTSAFESFRELITEKASLPGMTKIAVYEYLLFRFPDVEFPKYNAFTEYCRKNNILYGTYSLQEPHPRFETPPGMQLQFDWKEDIRMVDKNGEIFDFNVFSATLSYSRLHVFIYVKTRTTDDLLFCWLTTIKRLGGIPKEWLTDNMSALIVHSGKKKVRSKRAFAFAKEAGFEIQLCKKGTPQTKGKDESANRFINRLKAFEYDFEGEEELIGIISHIEKRSNEKPNNTTGLPPLRMFMKEKEYLSAIDNMRLLEELVGKVSVQTVPSTMLVRAASKQWSVPRECINKKVKVMTLPGGQIVITLNNKIVAYHDASQSTSNINYTEQHHIQALENKTRYQDDDIASAARNNLALLDSLGDN